MAPQGSRSSSTSAESSTRQRILTCAAELFATKGYTETSVRELAAAVGMKGASIYNHFPSKLAILECMLEDCTEQSPGDLCDRDMMRGILASNPTASGLMSCLHLAFSGDFEEYYQNALSVILQEQHRNPLVCRYISDYIQQREQFMCDMVDTLKEQHVVHEDADTKFWARCCSSIVYAFASRSRLGIGDASPGYAGKGMVEMLYCIFELLLLTRGMQSG